MALVSHLIDLPTLVCIMLSRLFSLFLVTLSVAVHAGGNTHKKNNILNGQQIILFSAN